MFIFNVFISFYLTGRLLEMDGGGHIRYHCNITMNAVRNQLPVTDVEKLCAERVCNRSYASHDVLRKYPGSDDILLVCAGLSFVFISKEMIEQVPKHNTSFLKGPALSAFFIFWLRIKRGKTLHGQIGGRDAWKDKGLLKLLTTAISAHYPLATYIQTDALHRFTYRSFYLSSWRKLKWRLAAPDKKSLVGCSPITSITSSARSSENKIFAHVIRRLINIFARTAKTAV